MSIPINSSLLEEISRQTGFQLSGITNVQPPQKRKKFTDWIKAGLHGSMHWLEKEPGYSLRLNPEHLAPGSRSILILGARYPKNEQYVPGDTSRGYIASYAWGKDYHTVLRQNAARFVTSLSKHLNHPLKTRIVIDSAPVLEKPLAQSAGLGWQGKNTCLISPTHGSFFFLTGVFVDLEFEPTPTFDSDFCGTCRKCMDACPTKCILPDRTIDARTCISYLTIEHRGLIPRELRPAMGNMIFGCDICQSVCPWNKRINNSDVAIEFKPENSWYTSPRLVEMLQLQTENFHSLYKTSPIGRARRSGLLRNAAIAIGNQGDDNSIPLLYEIMRTEPDDIIRAHAAWALGQMRSKSAREILSKLIQTESNPSVLDEIRSALDG